MLPTDRITDELAAAFPHSRVHPSWCDCSHCRLSGDPVAARRERAVRIQAAVLGAFLVVLYALALFLAPEIAGALSSSPDQVLIDGGKR